MRKIQTIIILTMAFAWGVAGASSAQGAGAGQPRQPHASGIAGASLSVEGPGLGGADGPKGGGIMGPRHVTAVIKDRAAVQNTVRRRWEEAGADERKKMLDLQRQLRHGKVESVTAVDREELLDRISSKVRVASSPNKFESRPVSTQSASSRPPVLSDRQRRVLRERVRDLSPEQRQGLRARMTELNALNEVDQAILRDQLQQWINLPPEDRVQLDTYRERWESMSPEQQDALRNRMLRLREMSAEQRQELLDRTLGDQLSE
jgi:hypothetical protein